MAVLTVVVCIVYLVLYTLIAQLFTSSFLFAEPVRDETVSALIVAVSVTILVLLSAFILRNRSRRGLDRLLKVGLVLLVLQPILQYGARVYLQAVEAGNPSASVGGQVIGSLLPGVPHAKSSPVLPPIPIPPPENLL